MTFLSNDLVELLPLDPNDETHVEVYQRSRNDPEMRVTGSYSGCLTSEQAQEAIIERQDARPSSALCAIDVEGDIVGWAGVYVQDQRARVAEVAYYVLSEYWGEGYASEATELLVAFAFRELNARRVQASIQADNHGSKRVLEKLGFQQEGVRREAYYKKGAYKDITLWSLLEAESEIRIDD